MNPNRLRHSFFWFTFGIWTVGSLVALFAPRPEGGPKPWPAWAQLSVNAIVAGFLGGLFIFWIATRTRFFGNPGPIAWWLPFTCGLIDLPIWIGIVEGARALHATNDVQSTLFGTLMLATPALLAELTYRVARNRNAL